MILILACSLKLLQIFYPESPLASDIVGTENSIEDIRLEDLRDNLMNFTPVNSHIFFSLGTVLELM